MGAVQDPPQNVTAGQVAAGAAHRTIVVTARLLEASGLKDPDGTTIRDVDTNTSVTLDDLFQLISSAFGMRISFQEYLCFMHDINLCSYDQDASIDHVIFMSPTKSDKIELTIGQPRSKEAAPPEEEMALGASASPTGADKMYWHDSVYATGSKEPDPAILAFEYHSRSFGKHETGYVGLVNQAMTCYLNSLLQALFMTPEFRNALYRWEFSGSDEEASKSIPFQLQKLFLHLQTTSRSAVETTNLTHSFGWDSSEAWQQHDIQELCRVMFDALEQCFKNTDQADLISNLYEGKMKDYVKCLSCGTESAREDTFLDIPLPIKPFGSDEAFHSLEEALRAFVEPEVLTDNNKYECSKCNCLCDAHKGLKFTRFPYLLTIHLKRFDFDYQTFLRIKLNDKVSFPKDLNLNSFIGDSSIEQSKVEVQIATPEKTDDTSTIDSGAGLDTEDGGNGALTPPHQDPREEDEGIDLGAGSQEKAKVATGPYNYELFSIMVHSGSTSGGHYYAYVKDFITGNWFCFNDQSVSSITFEDIRRTYGGSGSRNYYSSSSSNAYMLIYRQVDITRNAHFFSSEDLPAHIKTLVKRMNDEEFAEMQARELERNMICVVICSGHVTLGIPVQKEIKIHKNESLASLTKLAWEELKFDQFLPLERCRLVGYEPLYDNIECAYDNREHESLTSILNQTSCRRACFYLETREENETFEDYKDGGTSIKIYQIDVATEEVEDPVTVRINLDNNVIQLRDLVAENFSLDPETLRMAKEERCPKAVKPLEPSNTSLKREDITRSTKIFIEGSGREDSAVFLDSLMYKIIDRFEHTKIIVVRLPDTSKEALENMQIAPYIEEISEEKPTSQNTQVTTSESTIKQLPDWKSSVPLVTPVSDISPSLSIVSSPSIETSTKVVSSCQSKPVCHTSVSSKSPVAFYQSNLSDNEEDLSGENVSLWIAGEAHPSTVNSDQSASEDSSLTSDSDRTLVGDPPEDKLSQGSHSPEYHNVSSPEDESKEETGACSWDYSTARSNYMDEINDDDLSSRYFRVRGSENRKELNISVDNRMTVREFRRKLQKHVGVSEEHFKLYTRIYDMAQISECTQQREKLGNLGQNFDVVLSRALQAGEYLIKVYVIELENCEDPAKFVLEVIISEGNSVLQVKEKIVEEINQKFDMILTTEKLRLRKKCWKSPQTIFFDAQIFTKDIPLSHLSELYIQELDGPEIKSDREDELCLFSKRWRPSSYTTDPLKEFIVPDGNIDSLIEQLSILSGIKKEDVRFCKGISTFPCDMSVIDIESELDWKLRFGSLDQEPLFIMDDGGVIYYKDITEELKELTEKERNEITAAENSRLHRDIASILPSVSRKTRERGLKIYLNQPQ